MKRIIMYHDDADGRCAAAIVARAYDPAEEPPEHRFFPMQYGDPIPWEMLDGFEKDEDEFWLLNFSLPIPEMTLIQGEVGRFIVWIDHHVTAIETLTHFERLPGTRDPKTAACLLTWKFCHPKCLIPPAVRYIADRDMWQFEYGDATRYFYEIYKLESTQPSDPVWDKWLSEADINSVLAEGKKMYEPRIRALKEIALRAGFEMETFPGTGQAHKTLHINYPGSGDLGQVIKDMGYEIAHCYVEQVRDGRLVRVHSLYSDVADVGAMAKEKGGGGHRGAAGWVEEIG